MKRPPSHRIGALAENLTEKLFIEKGWIVHRCVPDYGFDFLVCPCDATTVSMDIAFLQVKGANHALQASHEHSVPVAILAKHLRLWADTATPSYLAVVEVPSARVFLCNTWFLIDDLEDRSGPDWFRHGNRHTVYLPGDTVLEGDRLSRMARALKRRWSEMRKALFIDGKPESPDMARYKVYPRRKPWFAPGEITHAMSCNSFAELKQKTGIAFERPS